MRKDWAEVIILLNREIRSQLIDGKLTIKDPPCMTYGMDIEFTFGDNRFVYFMSENLINRIIGRCDMNDPYLIEMWADAICSVLRDLLLLVLLYYIIKKW